MELWKKNCLKDKNMKAKYDKLKAQKEIVIYSPDQGVLRYGEEYEFGEHIDRKYIDAYIYDDNLILLPASTDGIISIFDLKDSVYLEDFNFQQVLKNADVISKTKYIN